MSILNLIWDLAPAQIQKQTACYYDFTIIKMECPSRCRQIENSNDNKNKGIIALISGKSNLQFSHILKIPVSIMKHRLPTVANHFSSLLKRQGLADIVITIPKKSGSDKIRQLIRTSKYVTTAGNPRERSSAFGDCPRALKVSRPPKGASRPWVVVIGFCFGLRSAPLMVRCHVLKG